MKNIAVCSEIHTKHINTLCGQNIDARGSKNAVIRFILYSPVSDQTQTQQMYFTKVYVRQGLLSLNGYVSVS
jgi:chorismate mutase